MIDINNLNFKYHKYKQTKILNNISFKVKKGEVVCLLGPSGCGKTSTLRLIAGLEIPSSGSIYIEDSCVSDINKFVEPHKRGIGFLFQDFALFPHLTAKENIAWGLSKKKKINKISRIEELLIQTSMMEHRDKYPHELSGGEQQRVALARALAPKPSVLLLDEPFSSLDTNSRQNIREETNRILRDSDTTAIVVTHDPEEAMLIADKIILMNEGEIQQEGTAREIYSNPRNNFVASFLGYVNHIDGLVNGQIIETAAGNFHNTNFSDKMNLDLIIRPQDIDLSITLESQNAIIQSIKYIGANSHVSFTIETENNPKSLMAIISRKPDFKEGDRISFKIKEQNIFIFEKI